MLVYLFIMQESLPGVQLPYLMAKYVVKIASLTLY